MSDPEQSEHSICAWERLVRLSEAKQDEIIHERCAGFLSLNKVTKTMLYICGWRGEYGMGYQSLMER